MDKLTEPRHPDSIGCGCGGWTNLFLDEGSLHLVADGGVPGTTGDTRRLGQGPAITNRINDNEYTVCPRSSDSFYVVTYYIKWVTTSWTYSSNKYIDVVSLISNKRHFSGHVFQLKYLQQKKTTTGEFYIYI